MWYRVKQSKSSSASSIWPEFPDLRQDELCRRVFEQAFLYKARDNRNLLLEYLRNNVPFQGYRKGVLPPLGRVVQIIDIRAMLLESDGVAAVLFDTWRMARTDLADAVRDYCAKHSIASKVQLEGQDGSFHRWMDATLAAHAAAVIQEAGVSCDVLDCRLMLCVWTGCRRIGSREGEVTLPPPDLPSAEILKFVAPVQRSEEALKTAGVSHSVKQREPQREPQRELLAEPVRLPDVEPAAYLSLPKPAEPPIEPDPLPAPEIELSPSPVAVPLRRALHRHDDALRRVRSEATSLRQLAEDEVTQRLPEMLLRLQESVHEATDAVREMAAAITHECDGLVTQIEAVSSPLDRARMRDAVVRVRGSFDHGRSERQRGLRLFDELHNEVHVYVRRRAELCARFADAAAERDHLLRDGIEFGAAAVLSAVDVGLLQFPADDAVLQELEDGCTRLRAMNQKLDALLQEHVQGLLRVRRSECAAGLVQVEAAVAQGVASAAPIARRLQRVVEQFDAAPRRDDVRALLQAAAAAVAEADRLADELGVERAARQVYQEPDWDGVLALLGSLWLKREWALAFVVFTAARRAGHLPSKPVTIDRFTQAHLRDALAFLGGDSSAVVGYLLLDSYWPDLLPKLPASDNALYFLLLTAFVAAGDTRFSADKFWQPAAAAETTMLERMPIWFALGERLMHGEPWQISTEKSERRLHLAEVEQSLRTEFVRRPNGRYARVSADGISNMLQVEQQKMLPDLEKRVETLFSAVPGSDAWVRTVDEFSSNAEVMFDRYFGALNESRHSHMRRNLLHRLTGFLDKARHYIALRIEQHDYDRSRPFVLADLQRELDGAADLLGADVRALVNALLQRATARRAPTEPQDGAALTDAFGERICAAMFDRTDLVQRLPRTAEMVFSAVDEAQLDWDVLLEAITLDLSEPRAASEMLLRFTEAGFYFGAESVAADVDAAALQDLQRERRHLETQVDALLARLDAHTEAMRENRRKGRLRALLVHLQQEISVQEEIEREADAAKRKTLNSRLAKLKEDVRLLEDAIEKRNESADLSQQAVGELMRGLAVAREVHMRRLEHGVDTASHIVEEVFHFLEFDGTSLAKVTQAIDRHTDELAGAAAVGDGRGSSSLRAKVEHASWLEELLGAGLTESQLAVRREAWESWQRMSRMQNRLDDGGVAGDEAVILESFARRLAEATRLIYSKSGHDTLFTLRPLAWFETKFQQPRDALRRYKVRFLFVTGQISKRDLRILEDHVRSQNLLEDDWLNVFVAPNPEGAEALHRWIQDNRMLATCSVLDGRTVQEILKCKQNPTAAGRMCRLLLQAADPVHLEVFRFQNVVDADRDIFKGRAHEIKQIESGRGSFYVFGGRRIGKTSLLFAAEKQLRKAGAVTAYVSFEGHTDPQGLTVCRDVLRKLGVKQDCLTLDDFRELFTECVLRTAAEKSEKSEKNERREVVVFLDEVDRYITGCRTAGMRSHPLIHVLRALHQELHGKARFVMAGAIELWRQIKGRSDIPGAETPWANFATPIALGALNATDARAVVTAGFCEVLGVGLTEGVDRQIVENTTGHPAFVQFYCNKLHRRLHQRDSELVSMEDVTAVFKDRRDDNFVMYARDTLSLNLGDLTRLGVYLLAIERCDHFNTDTLVRLAPGYELPADLPWAQCLDELQMTGVIRSEGGLYRFSVPTYPELLRQMEASLQDDAEQLIQKIVAMQSQISASRETH